MESKLLTPKYITKEVCEAAVHLALRAVMEEGSSLHGVVRQQFCHISILVPGMENEGRTYPEWPIHPVLIYEEKVGDTTEWKGEYDQIAQFKALQLWHDRNDEKPGINVQLLFPGDTIYWGGVKRHGIVVTCSGIQPYFDQLIAGIVADTIKAMCQYAYATSGDAEKDFV